MDNHAAVNIRDILKDNGVQAGGEAEVHCRLPRCGGEAEGADELTRRREEGMLRISSTPRIWETTGGDHRSWTWTGAKCVKPHSKVLKDPNGNPCITHVRSCTKLPTVKSLATTRRRRRCGPYKETIDEGVAFS